MTLLERAERNYEPEPMSGCWLWTGGRTGQGYGMLRPDGLRQVLAHRHVYELLRGPIPQDRELDHLCRNVACVNPDHLQPVTHALNTRRGKRRVLWGASTDGCGRGHPESERYTRNGKGYCRVCQRAAVRAYRARWRA